MRRAMGPLGLVVCLHRLCFPFHPIGICMKSGSLFEKVLLRPVVA